MAGKVEIVGPLKGGWYAISEGGVVGQARFPDHSSSWVAWREYSARGSEGDAAAKPSPKKRRMF